MEDLLIETVRSRECLYNYNDPLYKNLKHKEVVWKEVAETVGENVKKCKQRWKSLRERARREFYYTPSGNSAASKGKWPYTKPLRFLKQFVKPTEPMSKYEYSSPTTVTFLNEPAEESRSATVNAVQSLNALLQDHEDRKKQTTADGGIFMFLQNLGEKIIRANFTDDEELEIQEALIGTLRLKMMDIKNRNAESNFSDD